MGDGSGISGGTSWHSRAFQLPHVAAAAAACRARPTWLQRRAWPSGHRRRSLRRSAVQRRQRRPLLPRRHTCPGAALHARIIPPAVPRPPSGRSEQLWTAASGGRQREAAGPAGDPDTALHAHLVSRARLLRAARQLSAPFWTARCSLAGGVPPMAAGGPLAGIDFRGSGSVRQAAVRAVPPQGGGPQGRGR